MKDASFEEFFGTIRSVASGAQVLPTQLTKSLFTQIALNAAVKDKQQLIDAVRLTSREFRVVASLMHHRDRVVSQAELTEHVYAQSFDRDSTTIEVFVARLR